MERGKFLSERFQHSVIIDAEAVRAKPFAKDFEEQIKLVNIPAYRKNILAIKENAEEIFWDTFENAFEEKARLSAILNVVKSQIDKLLAL